MNGIDEDDDGGEEISRLNEIKVEMEQVDIDIM